jgi:hypothetical protein
VSQENVELVLRLPYLDPDFEAVRATRDDALTAALVEAAAVSFRDDVECVFRGLIGGERTYTGFEGFRAAFADWLAPWATYRNEVEEAIDCGDRVLVLYDVFGRLEGSPAEVKLRGGDIYTLRDGKIARIEFCRRAQALKAVGLEG